MNRTNSRSQIRAPPYAGGFSRAARLGLFSGLAGRTRLEVLLIGIFFRRFSGDVNLHLVADLGHIQTYPHGRARRIGLIEFERALLLNCAVGLAKPK